jgi:hypothetical protein
MYIHTYVGAEIDEDEEAASIQKAKDEERSGPLNAVAGFRYLYVYTYIHVFTPYPIPPNPYLLTITP